MNSRLKLATILKYSLGPVLVGAILHIASLVTPLPSIPDLVVDIAVLIRSQMFWQHLTISLSRIFLSICIAAVVGIFFGTAASRAGLWATVFNSTILPIVQALPPIAWTVMCVLLFGISQANVIFIVTIILVSFFAVNTLHGISNIQPRYVEAARVYTNNPNLLFRYVEMPMLSPFLLSALRISYGVAWQVIVLAEMFGASNGLGYLINDAYYLLSIRRVVSLSVIIVFIFPLTNWLLMSATTWALKRST